MKWQKYEDSDSMKTVLDRLSQLEVLVSAKGMDNLNSSIMSRKELSMRLGLSERTIRDNELLRVLELKLGKTVYYDWTEVVRILKLNNIKKEN